MQDDVQDTAASPNDDSLLPPTPAKEQASSPFTPHLQKSTNMQILTQCKIRQFYIFY